MIKKKVCMLGAFAVGKTSLVQQYVHSIFSRKYHTTVGVKIDKKTICIRDKTMDLILWDLHGKDEFQDIRMSYLRGASGCIYVVDGTRRKTLEVFHELYRKTEEEFGDMPFVLALNKWDLHDEWEIDSNELNELKKNGAVIIETSAKTGLRVEEAFLVLARLMVGS